MDQLPNRRKSSGPPGFPMMGSQLTGNPWGVPQSPVANYESEDINLFSSSLPVLSHEKLSFTDSGQDALEDVSANLNNLSIEMDTKDLSIDDTVQQVGDFLPDDDEFLRGLIDDYEPPRMHNHAEELEDYDVFGIGGGLELDFDPTDRITMNMAKPSIGEGFKNDVINQFGLTSGIGTVTGEHPYGEHPSRTLFVRNINSNVEDSELRSLFETFGDIRTLYTATKHRGFVMISYYDIRAARSAMRALQNKPLRRRKLDIHFSIPKDNPSDKDLNQGTLVIFNLEPSISNDELRQIFGSYGEVKEIRETPHKRHHRFIEFFDARDADAALRALNKSEIGGKRIKLEPSRPGGARRNLMNQLSHDTEQDDVRIYRHHLGSPISNSPPGAWLQFGSPTDSNSVHAYSKSPTGRGLSPVSLTNAIMSNTSRIAPIGKESNRINPSDHPFSGGSSSFGGAFQNSRSFSDYSSEFMSSSPGTLPSFGPSTSGSSALGTFTGSQFLWPSPKPYGDQSQSPWHSPSFGNPVPSNNRALSQGLSLGNHQSSYFSSSDNGHLHAVGSAPSGIPLQSHFGLLPESPETSFVNQIKYGNVGASRSGAGLLMNMMGSRPSLSSVGALNGNMSDGGSPNFRVMPHHRLGHGFFGSAPYQGTGFITVEALAEQIRSRRAESLSSQVDSKKQYQLDLDKIACGEDTRTTLMIKNIPNKYTSKMLLAAIDENHKGTYDFFYLPIDFKNKCNVGYAFINMVSPARIISFYEEFNGRRWEKFNSEKVASLAYARIQGRAALISHFQNSSLLNEDKRCRPILFHSDGPDAGNQEPFPMNGLSASPPLEDWASVGTEFVEGSTSGAADEPGAPSL